ncbi:MAG: response regulator [Candidatus Abyssubacteria bacterium]|nr:response regulator [Candidatus Abyssubacteria bacterium]
MDGRKTILLTEPDQEFRKAVRKMLRESGYDIVDAKDGREALSILSTNAIDLIIAALKMPNLDGIELMGEINRAMISAPVIFVTGYGDIESYMDLMNMGAFDYLNEPIKAPQILRVVKRALEAGAGPRSVLRPSRAEVFKEAMAGEY